MERFLRVQYHVFHVYRVDLRFNVRPGKSETLENLEILENLETL